MRYESALLIPSFIVEVLKFFIECMYSKGMPPLQFLCHIDELYGYITFGKEEYTIGDDIPYRPKKAFYELW